jgi:hypothetical protein
MKVVKAKRKLTILRAADMTCPKMSMGNLFTVSFMAKNITQPLILIKY